MNRKRIAIIAAVGIVLLLLGVIAYAMNREKPIVQRKPSYSQLTGLEVEPDVAKRPILAVIIENSQAARPQTGLDAAGIVFEATTEGGVTRYLALYQEEAPAEVGPVRSLRLYLLDWAMGFDASIAHVGGSPEALQSAKDRNAKSLNEFDNPAPYFRSNDRDAPHNMYARLLDLRKLQEELGHDTSVFQDIPRSAGAPLPDPLHSTIAIDYSGPEFLAEFRYDPARNAYARHLGGEPHVDQATGNQITVKNLVVIQRPAADRGTGSGEALVFKDGDLVRARWQQDDHDARMILKDDQGNEVPLNRGDTWIAAVSDMQHVSF